MTGFKNIEFKYPVEYGISYSGRFLNENGKPEKTMLTILQMKPRNMMLAETNDQGVFYQSGLQFYDTVAFTFKSDKAKDKPYGKVELLNHESPPIGFKEVINPINILQTASPQRLISEYEVPKNTRMLKTVEVKASRLPRDESEQPDYRVKHPYGRPDYVLKAKDIKTGYGNILFSMQGRFPGLVVKETDTGWVVYSQRASSISSSIAILVMVNNVVLGGNPADILSSINPMTVESIEVTTRLNVLYGSAGGNGVISIHTKEGASEDYLESAPNF